jgi:uncharacterized protein YigA (DUF484 family)
MKQQETNAQAEEAVNEQEVADYLRAHPTFFERHQPLLLRLKLPHESGPATVSLVERQIAMLRQRNAELERQLKDLVAVAKANNALVDNIHALAVKLMGVSGTDELLDRLETSLREDFGAERAVLVLFPSDPSAAAAKAPGFVKHIDRDDPALKPFAVFLKSARPRCGPLRDRQKAVLFDRDAEAIVSAAVVPLGRSGELGFLTIGSRDPNHFHAGQRVDFLARLGELIGIALESGYERASRT